MMGDLLQFPRKPRLVDAIAEAESLDSFGYDLPCDSGENNRRPDGNLIVPCRLPTKGDNA